MRLDFIACKYTHFIQYGKTIEYFFAKRIRNFAEIKRISPPNGSHKTITKNREFMKQMKRFYSSGPVFFIKFVLWTKETKETWKNNRNFPLRPKTSHAALTPHAPFPKLPETNCRPAGYGWTSISQSGKPAPLSQGGWRMWTVPFHRQSADGMGSHPPAGQCALQRRQPAAQYDHQPPGQKPVLPVLPQGTPFFTTGPTDHPPSVPPERHQRRAVIRLLHKWI